MIVNTYAHKQHKVTNELKRPTDVKRISSFLFWKSLFQPFLYYSKINILARSITTIGSKTLNLYPAHLLLSTMFI